MEFHQLRSFVTVASVGSVSQAARQLNLTQPAVSQHIRALERELRVELFERGTRGMRLTDQGIALLGHARGLLAEVAELQLVAERLRGQSQSLVRIAATPSMAAYLLPEALRILGLPDRGLQLVIYERPTIDAIALVATRSVEFALVRDCQGCGLELEPLMEDPLVIATGRDDPCAREGFTLRDLAERPFVFFRHTGREVLYEAAISACAAAGFAPRVVCQGVEFGTMGFLVRSGAAVAIAPVSIVYLWGQEQLRVTTLPQPGPKSYVFLARMAGTALSEPAQRVVRALRKAVAARTAEQPEVLGSESLAITPGLRGRPG